MPGPELVDSGVLGYMYAWTKYVLLAEEVAYQLALLLLDIGEGEIRDQKPDPAVDVVPDPAGGDHALLHIHRGDAADGEAEPQWMSGMANDAPTMPGSVATLATSVCSDSSRRESSSIRREA